MSSFFPHKWDALLGVNTLATQSNANTLQRAMQAQQKPRDFAAEQLAQEQFFRPGLQNQQLSGFGDVSGSDPTYINDSAASSPPSLSEMGQLYNQLRGQVMPDLGIGQGMFDPYYVSPGPLGWDSCRQRGLADTLSEKPTPQVVPMVVDRCPKCHHEDNRFFTFCPNCGRTRSRLRRLWVWLKEPLNFENSAWWFVVICVVSWIGWTLFSERILTSLG